MNCRSCPTCNDLDERPAPRFSPWIAIALVVAVLVAAAQAGGRAPEALAPSAGAAHFVQGSAL